MPAVALCGIDSGAFETAQLFFARGQHGQAVIQRGNPHVRVLSSYFQRNVVRARGQIKHPPRGAGYYLTHEFVTPPVVHADAQKMIEKIVAACNAAEHA
jgi:hypothetical protein